MHLALALQEPVLGHFPVDSVLGEEAGLEWGVSLRAPGGLVQKSSKLAFSP